MNTKTLHPRTNESRLLKLQSQIGMYNAVLGVNHPKTIATRLAYQNLLLTIKK